MEYKVVDKLNLENLYKNGKGRRCGKYYNYLIFQKYGLKLLYEPYEECYCLIETGLEPDEAQWIYYYRDKNENGGEILVYDLGDEVRIHVSSYIIYLDKHNFNLCIDE